MAIRRGLLVAVAGVLSLGGLPLPGSTPGLSPAEAAQSIPPRARSTVPRFSDPLWLPLRSPARISCVKTNCHPPRGAFHGYWAIDFVGKRGDPVFAAGFGIAHVGGRARGCGKAKQRSGNWVWVDHGRGQVTIYRHLDSIEIRHNRAVTPATLIGTMGSTGECGTNYLHYERRRGLTGSRLYPGEMKACRAGKRVIFPRSLGYRNWDSVPSAGPGKVQVSSDGVSCR